MKIEGKIEHNMDFLKRIIAPHILDVGGVSLIKEALVLQVFADRLHCLLVGASSSGSKSSYRFSLLDLIPDNFDYVTVSGLTKVGLNDVIINIGNNWSLINVDEVDKIEKDNPATMNTMLDMMQSQTIKIVKHRENMHYTTPVNIFAIANPRSHGGEWIDFGNPISMRKQLPFADIPKLRRFHFIIFTNKYSESDFENIGMFIAKNSKYKNPYSGRFVESFNDYVAKARQIPTSGLDNPKKQIPDDIVRFIMNIRRNDDKIVLPITPEIWRGILEIAWANARIRLSAKIEGEDWEQTKKFVVACLMTSGVNKRFINSLKN